MNAQRPLARAVRVSTADLLGVDTSQSLLTLVPSRCDSVSSGLPVQNSPETDPGRVATISVLVAHSDPFISAGLTALLRKRREFKVVKLGSERWASRLHGIAAPADVVIADYCSGMHLIDTGPPFSERLLILTSEDSEARIWQALERGARGYLLLGCSLQELIHGIRAVNGGGVAVAPLVAHRMSQRITRQVLTPREEAVLGELMLGRCDKAIALKLSVAVGTVKSHLKSILVKLEAGNRTEAVVIAQRRGILSAADGMISSSSRQGISAIDVT
jgi:DNA-binding NarL/FixJ family response regulator